MYFREKAAELINFPQGPSSIQSQTGFLLDNNSALSKNDIKIRKFIEDTEIKKYPILVEDEVKYLTPRQAQCVYYLARGRTYKEIGSYLGISDKCVEGHITSAKLKVNCGGSACLINIFEKNPALERIMSSIGER